MRLKETGFRFQLVFLRLPAPELAIERVASRVRRGGHDIPEDIIRRRFKAGLENFSQLYQPRADHWLLYENICLSGPKLVGSGGSTEDNESVFDDADEVTRRFQVAVREALRDHRRAGNSVAVWRDGKVEAIPPAAIEVGDSSLGIPVE
jgi:hypothetical protein